MHGIKQNITICNMSVLRPTIKECDRFERPVLPYVARLRGLTYCASVLVDLVHDIEENGKKERRVYREVLLAKIPVMLKSKYCNMVDQNDTEEECHMDQGGYFIINGVEKALLAQEKLHTNRIYIFPVKQPSRQLYICEVRSCHELKLRSTSTIYMYLNSSKDGVLPEIMCQLPFIEVQMPLYALFLLIGIDNKDNIIDIVFHDRKTNNQAVHLLSSMLDSSIIVYRNRDEVIDWIGKEGTRELTRERRLRYLDHILSNELLPHLGLDRSDNTNFLKSLFIGRMVKRLINTYMDPEKNPCDDRDDYANKRIDTSGMLMSLLFRQLYRNFLKSLHTTFHKLAENNKLQYTNIGDHVNHKKISSGFKYAFSTGNWGLQKGKATQTGVAQIMSRMTLISAIANLRRINTPINREGKAPKPRMLHHTSWGIVCPAETPEGGSCGLRGRL